MGDVLLDGVAIQPNMGGQTQFAENWTDFIIGLEGGWYSGKTFIGSGKLLALHEYNAFDLEGNPTFVPSLIVAPTYSNAMDFCVPHFEERCQECGLNYRFHGSGYLANGRYSAPAITIKDFGTKRSPSVIIIRSADIPKRITGFTVGAAWGDEPTRWKCDRLDPLNDPFIQMTGRVRDTRARLLQILLTYTNEGDATRAYEEFHSGRGDRALYRASTKENPLAKEFYDRQKELLTDELAKQYLDGLAINLRGGKIYSAFDSSKNVDKRLTLRKDMPVQASFDFNIVPGMHLEVGQHHTDADLLTCIYEIHGPRWTVADAVIALIKLLQEVGAVKKKNKLFYWDWAGGPLQIFGDATGGSEWTGTGQSCYTIIERKLQEYNIPYRVRVPKSNPPIIDRINAVNCSLIDLTGSIHYLIHPRCIRLIEDFQKLQRDKYGEIDKTERKLSHASDAEGYRIWWLRPLRVDRQEIGGRVSV